MDKKAINIGVEQYKDVLQGYYYNGSLHAECYLKVVAKYNFDDIYWYFSIVGQDGKNYSMLIDVNTGNVTLNNVLN